jgi:predicted outer membrane repeat protein
MVATLAMVCVVMMAVLASPAHAEDIIVTNTNDSGAGSLRQAILDANAAADEDEITFESSLSGQTVALASQLPTVTDTAGLTVDGESADITVSGNHAVRVFFVASGGKLTLSNLTVANGAGLEGGGIYNSGTLTVSNSTLSGNSGSSGGGIFNDTAGTLKVSNSTFSGNSTNFGGGGGIFTFSASGTVSNTTFSGNSAANSGGGILNIVSATLKNTIVANSTSVGNCIGPRTASITDGGYNLDSGTTCGFATANNSISGVDPLLGPLQDNGGPTDTHAPQTGSPAIDKGNNAFALDTEGNPLQFDQRGEGFARIVGPAVDIGAFEVQTPPNQRPTIAVSKGGQCPSDTSAQGTINLGVSDDAGAAYLSLSATSSNTALLPNSNITFGGSGQNRKMSVRALDNKSGTARITITVSDQSSLSATRTVTVKVGTGNNNTMSGTGGADMLFGLDADDLLEALEANDLLCGGEEEDILIGGVGHDTLRGGSDEDRLSGGGGADTFDGGTGTDTATDFDAGEGDTKVSIP